MSAEKRDFDREAAAWDDNPARVKLAKDIAHAISEQIVLTPEMDVLDFGCGTGLLSAELYPYVRSVTGVDSSQGMLDIFNRKIAKLKMDRAKAVLVDLEKGGALTGSYHLVLCNMTLHHIKEIVPLFDCFRAVTAPGGYLCVADLDLDGGQFHGDNAGVFHFGFDRVALRGVLREAGFENLRDMDAADVVKPARSGAMRRFTVFLMTGQRGAD